MYSKYKIKSKDGRNNLCGKNIKECRLAMKPFVSQRELADRLQRAGLEMDKCVVRRIENGQRYVNDIELQIIATVLGIDVGKLLRE